MEQSNKVLSLINEVDSTLEDETKMHNYNNSKDVSMKVHLTDNSLAQSYILYMA